jgi:beta-barrel assembly-enhancing protease
MRTNRRKFLQHSLCGGALCLCGSTAMARVEPQSMNSLLPPGYEPADQDERGLWQACDKLEEAISYSNLRIEDPVITGYLKDVVTRLIGKRADSTRVYLVRDSSFNASMAPNGMMLVHTGLLARMRNEAQLAAVLGHESGHYLRRHSVRSWRDLKAKSAVMGVLALAGAAATGATGGNWYDLANAINSGLVLSLFRFSRDMESEADAYGVRLMHEAGYPAEAAAEVWKQLIEEGRASALARKKKYNDRSASVFSTHPPSKERMLDLAASSREIERLDPAGGPQDARRTEWLAAVAPMRAALIEEQIRLNDAGASLYLVNSLSQDGWDSTLRYYEGESYRLRGESDDGDRAASAYAAAITFENPLPEAFRSHGYAQIKKGNVVEGRQALQRYLDLRPDAADAAMVRFALPQ